MSKNELMRRVPEKHFLRMSRILCKCSLIIRVFDDIDQTVSQKFLPREVYKYRIIFLMDDPTKG